MDSTSRRSKRLGKRLSALIPEINEEIERIKVDINNINKSIKFLTDLAIGAEAATLGSYIVRDIKETNDKVRDNELKDNRKTLRDRLLKEKELLQSIKDNKVSKDDIKDRLFDTEFYQEHKDDSMRLILKKGHYEED